VDVTNKNIECDMNQILYNVFVEDFYLESSTQMYYCLYCLNNCKKVLTINSFNDKIEIDGNLVDLHEHNLKNYNKKSRTKFNESAPKCCCKNTYHHDSIERNNYCLIEMIDNIYYDKYFNRIQFPSQIINNPHLSSKYFSPIIKFHDSIYKELEKINMLKERRDMDLTYDESSFYIDFSKKYQKNELDQVYLSCIEILKSFDKVFSYDYLYINNDFLQNAFGIKFLLSILDVPEISNDNFISVKINSLLYFRKFYLMPKLKYCNWNNFHNYENISPMHRILFTKNFEEFTTLIGVSSSDYLTLIEKVYKIICVSDWLVKEEELVSLAIEFYELILLIISCNFQENEGMIFHLTFKVCKVADVLKNKSEYQKLMIKYLENFVLSILFINNDNLFLKGLLNEAVVVKEEDKNENILDIYSKIKNFADEAQKELTPDELENIEIEKIKKEQQSLLPFENEHKYSFESGDFQNSLIKALFSFNKSNDINNYLNNITIYDMLVNKHDFYSDSLMTIGKCKLKLFDKNIIKFLLEFSHIKNSENEEDLRKIDEFIDVNFLISIKEEINKLEENKMKFYQGIIKSESYYNSTISTLDKLEKKLNSDLFIKEDTISLIQISMFTNSEEHRNLFNKQLIFFKMNFVDTLISICASFTKNNNFKLYFKGQSENIINKILFLLENYFLVENPFLLSVCFNSELINYLFELSTPNLLEFFRNNLKTLNKYYYLINFHPLLLKLTTMFSISKMNHTSKELPILLEIFNLSLTNSSEKTVGITNSIISFEIKNVIINSSFNDLVNDFVRDLESDLKLKLNINLKNSSDNLLTLIFECLVNLQEDYFYLMNDYIDIDIVNQLLEYENISPLLKISLVNLYSRFFVQSPFHIVFPDEMTQKNFNDLEKIQNLNLIGKFTKQSVEDDLKNKIILLENKIDKSDNIMIKESTNYSEFEVNYNRNMSKINNNDNNNKSQTKEKKTQIEERKVNVNDFNEINKVYKIGLQKIFISLEKFKTYYINSFTEEESNNMELFVKYFSKTALFPCTFSIYKILYFTTSLGSKHKYLIYKLITYFLHCNLFFLNTITNFIENVFKESFFEQVKLFTLLDKTIDFTNYSLDKIPADNEKNAELYKNMKSQSLSEDNVIKLLNFALNKITNLKYDLSNDLAQITNLNYSHLETINILYIWYRYATWYSSIGTYLNLEMNNTNEKIISSKEEKIVIQTKESIEKETFLINIGKTLFKGIKKTGFNLVNAVEKILGLFNIDNHLNDFNSYVYRFIEQYDLKKSNFNENNVLNSIFSDEIDVKTNEVKKIIAADLLYKLRDEEFFVHSISLYDESDTILIETINMLFITDPNLFQDLIKQNSKLMKSCIFNYIQKQIFYLSQFVMIEFHNVNNTIEVTMKRNLLEILEFLRLLCENHHKIFQTFLLTIKLNDNILFIEFLFKLAISILKSIELFKVKKKYVLFFKENNNDYLEEIVVKIFDLLIEIFQGCLESNFDEICNNQIFKNFIDINYQYLDYLENERAYEFYFANFFRLTNTLLEEINNKEENKYNIIKNFNPKKLMSICLNGFRKLYKISNDVETPIESLILNDTSISYHKLILEKLTSNEELKDDNIFILITNIYSFVKNSSQLSKAIKFQKIIINFNNLVEIKENEQFQYEDKEMIMFFNSVIKDVEISYKFRENIEEFEVNMYQDLFEESDYNFGLLKEKLNISLSGVIKINYLINMDSLLLNNDDIEYFYDHAPYHEFNEKLKYILSYYTNRIQSTIEVRKSLWNYENDILKQLYKTNYTYVTYISIILSLITNCLVFYDLKYISQKSWYFATSEEKLYGIKDHEQINWVKSFSYDNTTFWINFIHVLFLMLAIINYLSFNLYGLSFNKNEAGKSFFKKVYYCLKTDEIRFILTNFLLGLKGLIGGINSLYYFSFQLFAIFPFVPTMNSIIISVKSRYKQFLSAALLICIMILFYSSVSFYFFSDEFETEENRKKPCNNLLNCFLFLFNNGLRTGSLGLPIKKIDQPKYWPEFIFDWIFYFSIILIMLNIINGIIVDTFQALREYNNYVDYVRNNVCYICSIDKNKFEMHGVDFSKHLINEHNILNYFHYIIKIMRTEEQNLNSLDSEVLKSIKIESTEFFPVKKSLSLKE
jgi:hypothetical protein